MLEELHKIVRCIGKELLSLRCKLDVELIQNHASSETEADLLAHNLLIKYLEILAPKIPVVSEEDINSQTIARPEKYFLIDPIDGTASFLGGFSGYVTQVALVVDHLPQLAAIYAPAFDQVFLAKRGFGAFLNGNRLSLGINGDTKTMIDNYPEPRGITKRAFNELSYLRYLECGGISLKICRVADGTADLFFKDVTVRDWDVGAPLLVLEEAGGSLVLSDGTPMKFNGAYDKSGLVAGRTPDLVGEVVSWLHSQKI